MHMHNDGKCPLNPYRMMTSGWDTAYTIYLNIWPAMSFLLFCFYLVEVITGRHRGWVYYMVIGIWAFNVSLALYTRRLALRHRQRQREKEQAWDKACSLGGWIVIDAEKEEVFDQTREAGNKWLN